jgi:hypothetical protein
MKPLNQIKLGLTLGVLCGALLAMSDAQAVTPDELKALRAQKKELCLKDAACSAKLEEKAQARRDKAAEKLRGEIATLSRG